MAACIAPIRIRDPGNQSRFIDVPCSRCYACLQRKRSEWLLRLEHEHRDSTRSLFITLTYNYENLPRFGNGPCFRKKDLQDYFKRLRHKCKFRYYVVAEYGSKTQRPHYHALFFNFEGNIQEIEKEWKKGHVHIGSVTSASINYCAAYVITKQQYDYERDDPRRPFALHSRRPALGANYVERYSRYNRDGRKNHAPRPFGGGKVSLPRYYKEKIFSKFDRDLLAAESRRWAEETQTDTCISLSEFLRRNPGKDFHDYHRYRTDFIMEKNKQVFSKLKQNRDGKSNI